jgi:hypothetical protein
MAAGSLCLPTRRTGLLRAGLVAGTLSAVAAVSGAAQERPSPLLPGLDSAASAQLKALVNSQRQIRIWTTRGERFIGNEPQLEVTGLSFRWRGQYRDTIPLQTILAIERRSHRKLQAGLGGAAIGGFAAFVVTLAYDVAVMLSGLAQLFSPEASGDLPIVNPFAAAVVGAGLGVVAGVVIESRTVRWKLVYSAP